MDFQYFFDAIPKIIAADLMGDAAHIMMAPPERFDLFKNLDLTSLNPRKSAVMLLLYPKMGKINLVLIKRNEYKGVHSAQISFPGGKFEETDASFENTALRETFEEIGVSGDTIKIIRPLSATYIPPSNFMVYPFLGYCADPPVFLLNPREVSGIIELPIENFLSEKMVVLKRMSTSYNADIEVPCYEIDNNLVWGATAMILSELKEILKKL
jgi:8-oxo-dGTP pyrophosphatase MutT (NUDIX family)